YTSHHTFILVTCSDRFFNRKQITAFLIQTIQIYFLKPSLTIPIVAKSLYVFHFKALTLVFCSETRIGNFSIRPIIKYFIANLLYPVLCVIFKGNFCNLINDRTREGTLSLLDDHTRGIGQAAFNGNNFTFPKTVIIFLAGNDPQKKNTIY